MAAPCLWTEGVVAGLISAGVTILGAGVLGLVGVGFHKREHRIITADRKKLEGLIKEHDKRAINCPLADEIGDAQTAMAGIALKLERLEANQMIAVNEKTEMHKKLDVIAEAVNYIRGRMDAQNKGKR